MKTALRVLLHHSFGTTSSDIALSTRKVYRVDIDFRNAFNAMSQDALWSVMRFFHIPDVDLLEQIYDDVSVRLAPNDEESATITSSTGVAQGSIISPQLFKIFMNVLLRMLTVTGQREGISHGLQIGEDLKDSPDAIWTAKVGNRRFGASIFLRT